ncbi:Uncharacterised protein [uncultured archaeon]|nr:Uncharacterised protein [uncultured archaeon]
MQMKILVPILSEKEDDPEFLEKVSKGATEIILLLVVDPSPKERFGFAAGFMQKGRAVMESARKRLGEKRKSAEDVIEWGDTQSKIMNMALLRKADKVIFYRQQNQYFNELVNRLIKEKIETEVI